MFKDNPELLKKLKKTLSKRFSGENNGMYGKTHSNESRDKLKAKAKGRFTLDWYKERNGDVEGERLYEERRVWLKNRNLKKDEHGRFLNAHDSCSERFFDHGIKGLLFQLFMIHMHFHSLKCTKGGENSVRRIITSEAHAHGSEDSAGFFHRLTSGILAHIAEDAKHVVHKNGHDELAREKCR